MAFTKESPNQNYWEKLWPAQYIPKTLDTHYSIFLYSKYSSCIKTTYCSFPFLYGQPKIYLTTFYNLI